MNTTERIKMVKAMEFICRAMNDEERFECWLYNGVADGDIERGDLEVKPDDYESLECYLDDTNFADIMHTFLWCMTKAREEGGLHCDGIVSQPNRGE